MKYKIKMHILIVSADGPYNCMGGLGVSIAHLARSMRVQNQGTRFTVVSPWVSKTSEPVIPNVKVHHPTNTEVIGAAGGFATLPYTIGTTLLVGALEACEKDPPDLVHAFDWYGAEAAKRVSQKYGVPLLWTAALPFHGLLKRINQLNDVHRLAISIEGDVFQKSSGIHCVSEAMASQMPKRDNIFVVYNGWGDPEDIKHWNFQPKSGPVKTVLFLGRDTTQKGLPVLANAVASKNWPEHVHLIITERKAGSDTNIEPLMSELETLPNVRLVKGVSCDTKWAQLNECDAVIMPSLFEPFGIAALEAQVACRPLICSGVDGLGDILPDDTFVKCKPTPEDICEAVKSLIGMDAGERKEMVKRGELSAREYTWEKHATGIDAIYQKLASKKRKHDKTE